MANMDRLSSCFSSVIVLCLCVWRERLRGGGGGCTDKKTAK